MSFHHRQYLKSYQEYFVIDCRIGHHKPLLRNHSLQDRLSTLEDFPKNLNGSIHISFLFQALKNIISLIILDINLLMAEATAKTKLKIFIFV